MNNTTCAKNNCTTEANLSATLYGKTVSVCEEHERTTSLGNWEGIKFNS